MNFRPLLAISLGLAMAAVQPAAAKQAPKPAAKETGSGPKLVSQYGDWSVYVSETKTRICYALGEPKDRKPAGLNRDPAYFFVSDRPGENVRNETSIVVGFPMKEGVDATLEIGGMSFPFDTKNDGAWLKNAAEEGKLIEALRKNRDFTLKSTSTRGHVTTDRYSLSGISQALDRVAKECK